MNHKIFLAILVLLALFVFTPPPQVKADDFYQGQDHKNSRGLLSRRCL